MKKILIASFLTFLNYCSIPKDLYKTEYSKQNFTIKRTNPISFEESDRLALPHELNNSNSLLKEKNKQERDNLKRKNIKETLKFYNQS